MIRLVDLLTEKYDFIGTCDRVRSKCEDNERYWHSMMDQKKKISDSEFLKLADVQDMLDEDEDVMDWIRDNKRQDSSASAYKSKWGNKNCVFFQVAGFEYIFVQ